jgi:hypothetical protein
MIFAKAAGPLREEVKKILGREAPELAVHSISPY